MIFEKIISSGRFCVKFLRNRGSRTGVPWLMFDLDSGLQGGFSSFSGFPFKTTAIVFVHEAMILHISYAWTTTVEAKECRDPGSNWGPPDLQSDALPTELSRLYHS